MNEERNPRGNTVLLTVIAVATLLVAVIGATFAYFSVTVTTENDASVIVKTRTLGVTFDFGADINITNLQPGDTIPSKTITIDNTSDNDALPITIDLEYTSTFPANSVIAYTFSSSDTTISGHNGVSIPGVTGGETTTSGTLNLLNATIPADTSWVCEFSMVFPNNTESAQDELQGKSFTGELKVALPGTETTPAA